MVDSEAGLLGGAFAELNLRSRRPFRCPILLCRSLPTVKKWVAKRLRLSRTSSRPAQSEGSEHGSDVPVSRADLGLSLAATWLERLKSRGVCALGPRGAFGPRRPRAMPRGYRSDGALGKRRVELLTSPAPLTVVKMSVSRHLLQKKQRRACASRPGRPTNAAQRIGEGDRELPPRDDRRAGGEAEIRALRGVLAPRRRRSTWSPPPRYGPRAAHRSARPLPHEDRVRARSAWKAASRREPGRFLRPAA